MQEFLIAQFAVRVLRWAEPTEDGELYEVLHAGRVIRADSLALLLSAVQGAERFPLIVPANLSLAWAA